MLNELIEYARKNNIPSVPGFKSKSAKWLIILNECGKFIDIVSDDTTYPMCPNLEQFEMIAGGITKSHFLLDTLAVVVLYDAKDKDLLKHKYFIDLLEKASKYEPALGLCAAFLYDLDVLDIVAKKAKALHAKATDTVTFRVGNKNVMDMTGWRDWWIDFRDSFKEQEPTPNMRCLISGEMVEPLTKHFKISGLNVVGGQSSGTALISFDKDAFTSFNLSQSLNASCSEQAAVTYRNALDALIEKAPKPIGDSLFLHWYKEPIREEEDPFGLLEFENSDINKASAAHMAKELFESVYTGKRPEFTGNYYYILQVSGAGGRIMVRDWLTGSFYNLVKNIRQWFEDLEIIAPGGRGLSPDFKFAAASLRMISYRPKEKISDSFERVKKELTPIMPRIWRSIIEDKPLPLAAIAKSLGYISSKLMNSESDTDDNLDRIACALLKAFIIRQEKSRGGIVNMKPELNKEHPSAAYQSGRAMAVLAAIQQQALDSVKAGVIQRYYTSASTMPKLVIGRLIQLTQHHLDKIGKENKGLAIWYENQLSEIMSRIGSHMPSNLTLEEQTLFALGYYQQKAYMNSGKNAENK